jgi:hypothetical protein
MSDIRVAQKVEEIFKTEDNFIRRYKANSKKVFNVVSKDMKVVPYNLKYLLHGFYQDLITEESDDYTA